MEHQEELALTLAGKALSEAGASKGGKARAKSLSPEQRSAIARRAVQVRWAKAKNPPEADEQEDISGLEEADIQPMEHLPEAKYKGVLRLLGMEIPCYVLSDGQRVIGRTSANEMLTGIKGSGAFEKTIGVSSLRPFINGEAVIERMVAFRLPEVDGLQRHVKGLPADTFIEVCSGFMSALQASYSPDATLKLTPRQIDMAIKAGIFVAACAKVGLDGLIDEATGYQYDRARDALEVKLNAYLEVEMRRWEKTFPDELWVEFGRLTGWSGSVTQRPKYWGKLVMELVYEYLDHDVAEWLKANAPAPRHGQNYHQWLSGQYGLRRLVEHIWKLVGIAQTCQNITELKDKMAELHGRMPVQYRMYLPMPKDNALVQA